MIKGISNSVKEVVAAYPVKGLKKEDLFERTWEVISECESRSVQILAIVSDGSSANRAFYQMHTPATRSEDHPELVFDTINLCAPERILYFIADPPHLLKTIRNCFAKSGQGEKCTRLLTKNKQFIVWKTIERLYLEDSKLTLRRCHKLNAQNVYLNSYTCMKTSYAGNVISNTVGVDLKDRKWPGTEETADFIIKTNNFFDDLNGAHTYHGQKQANLRLYPYTSSDDWRLKELRSYEKYLMDWEKEVNDNRSIKNEDKEKCLLSRQTRDGIYITINGFIGAVTYLLETAKVSFANARIFCQDPLEQTTCKLWKSVKPHCQQFS